MWGQGCSDANRVWCSTCCSGPGHLLRPPHLQGLHVLEKKWGGGDQATQGWPVHNLTQAL